jgi:hypothetical protein
MSNITTAFALSVRPMYFAFVDAATGARITWFGRSKGKIDVHIGNVVTAFENEYQAWMFASGSYPDLVGSLQRASTVSWRGYGLRAEMLLTMGEARFEDMRLAFDADILQIFGMAMEALDAVQVRKSVAKVVRVAQTKGVSWMEVRTKVSLRYQPEPVELAIRCLPSPLEEKTWAVRLRTPGTTDMAIVETQNRFDVLVRNLSYRGITVKDVQNGTCLDL